MKLSLVTVTYNSYATIEECSECCKHSIKDCVTEIPPLLLSINYIQRRRFRKILLLVPDGGIDSWSVPTRFLCLEQSLYNNPNGDLKTLPFHDFLSFFPIGNPVQ